MEVKEAVKEDKNSGYKQLLNEKNFLLNTFANIVSRFGDGIDTIAFSLLVYQITGSTLLVATLYAINGIPNIIFGMVSGVVCKYITDKKIMAICDFGRGACVTLVAVLFITGNLATWHLYVITFLNSSFESFRGPATTSIIPKILPQEKMEYGMAFMSSGTKVAEMIGLASAAFLIGILGLGGAIIIDAVTFYICGVLIMAIKLKDKLVVNEKLTVKSYFIDLKEGFSYVKKDGLILNIVIFAAVVNALLVPFNSMQAPYVKNVLNSGSSAMSVMSIAVLIGMTCSTILAPKIKEKIGNKKMFILGGIIVGISYCILSLLGTLPQLAMYIALSIDMFVLGVGALFLNFPLQIIMLKSVPGEYLPRVASIFNAGALCATPVVSCIVGVISEFTSIKILFTGFGMAVVILYILQSFSKNIKKYDNY